MSNEPRLVILLWGLLTKIYHIILHTKCDCTFNFINLSIGIKRQDQETHQPMNSCESLSALILLNKLFSEQLSVVYLTYDTLLHYIRSRLIGIKFSCLHYLLHLYTSFCYVGTHTALKEKRN